MWWRVLLPAAEPLAAAKFVGDEGCSASSCHGGGAGEKGNDAYTRWLKQDVHLRAVVTLGNARSKQIAAAAKLGNPLTE